VITTVFSPDSLRIATRNNTTPLILDARTGKPQAPSFGRFGASYESHTGAINFATFSPDGKRIVTASQDDTAKVWDAVRGELLATLRGHADRVFFAAFSPDGSRVVSTSGDRTARLWDLQVDRALLTLKSRADDSPVHDRKGAVNWAAFSPDGTLV